MCKYTSVTSPLRVTTVNAAKHFKNGTKTSTGALSIAVNANTKDTI